MNQPFLNSFTLKLLAMITMTIDHVGHVIFPTVSWFRYIGRVSFPIFCFLIVQGFFHTKDVKRYILRMLMFAFISEVIYDLTFFNSWFYLGKQNVLFTFIISLLMLYVCEKASGIYKMGAVVFCMFFAYLIKCDYNMYGVLLIYLLYCSHNNRNKTTGSIVIWSMLYIPYYQVIAAVSSIPIYFYNGKRGPRFRYVFYIFYPFHLLLLYLIKQSLQI